MFDLSFLVVLLFREITRIHSLNSTGVGNNTFSNTVIWKLTTNEATKLLLKFALSSALLMLGRDHSVLPSDVNTGGMLTILPS